MTDLDKLIAAAEAGEEYIERHIQRVFGGWRSSETSRYAASAYSGSLDAARSLHELLLCKRDPQYGYLVGPQYARIVHYSGTVCDATCSHSPARAWAIAALKAYRSMQVTE